VKYKSGRNSSRREDGAANTGDENGNDKEGKGRFKRETAL